MARNTPNTGFMLRDRHRNGLVLHALAMTVGLLGSAAANRVYTPERLWVHWVALAWGVLFGVHLFRFYRDTLASMTSKGRAEQLADLRRAEVASLGSVADERVDLVGSQPSRAVQE